jgi:hypothetical protein
MATSDVQDGGSDPFGPPVVSVMVGCLHCGEEYDSYRIEWRILTNHDGKPHGFWCCPIEGCDGKGFGFDIFPTDPNYVTEDGEKMFITDEDIEEALEDEEM